MTFDLDPNADGIRTLMFHVGPLMMARSFGLAHHVSVVKLCMYAPNRAVPCPPVPLSILRHARPVAAASHAQVQKQCCDDLEDR